MRITLPRLGIFAKSFYKTLERENILTTEDLEKHVDKTYRTNYSQ